MKHTIEAAYDKEFEEILCKLNLCDVDNEVDLLCYFCGDRLEKKDIYSVFPVDDEIKICCERISCIQKLYLFADRI